MVGIYIITFMAVMVLTHRVMTVVKLVFITIFVGLNKQKSYAKIK